MAHLGILGPVGTNRDEWAEDPKRAEDPRRAAGSQTDQQADLHRGNSSPAPNALKLALVEKRAQDPSTQGRRPLCPLRRQSEEPETPRSGVSGSSGCSFKRRSGFGFPQLRFR